MCVRECSAQATRAQSRPTSLCRRDCHHHAAVTRRSSRIACGRSPSSLHPCLLVMLHGDSDTTRRQGASCASHRHLHRRRLECARLPFLVAVLMLQSCSEQLLACLPQRLRLDEGHFRLVAPMRLQPIQPKFQIVDARRIVGLVQHLDQVRARVARAGSHQEYVTQPVLPGSVYRPA